MSSAFFGLNIAYTGLVAANAGLNTTANNISNIETEGYSRQVVRQTAADALRTFQSYGCAGAGVNTLASERQRNVYYDIKYWENNANYGEQEQKSYYCKMIENYLTDDNTVEGFSTIFNTMMADLQTAMDAGGDTSVLMDFVGSAENMCEYFNTLYNNLQKIQNDANQDIKTQIDQINSLAREICELNEQINTIENDGRSNANELRDQRDLIVDKLSKIVDVEIKEYDLTADQDDYAIGGTRYIVTIANGQKLVDGSDYRELVCTPREIYASQNQNNITGLYDITWKDTGEEIGVHGNIGGYLKGLVDVRDGNNAEYFHGKITKVNTEMQTFDVQVTEKYLVDINKNVMPDRGCITVGAKDYYYDSWSYSQKSNPLTGEIYGTYTFTLSQSTELNPDMITKDSVDSNVAIGQSVDYQGIPYYLEQLNEWVRCYAEAFNNIMGGKYVSNNYGESTRGQIFFTGKMENEDSQFGMTTDISQNKYGSTDDSYYRLTAANFEVRKAITVDADLMGTHTDKAAGNGKTDILSELYDIATNREKMSFRGCSAEDFLICTLGDAALNASSANTFSGIYESISLTIDNQRTSVSGVDTDEEAAYLISYQNAYNLSSKMISVLTEIYDRLILNTGV